MTRPLVVIAPEPAGVLRALRDALGGSGPAILVAESAAPAEVPAEVPRRVALVVETSGSTARPKRVALAADSLLASAAASASALGGQGQWLLALPSHYIAGLNVLVRSIAAQTAPMFLAPGRFSVEAFCAAVDRLDGELLFTSLVPAQLGRLLEASPAQNRLRRFARILVGGQATPAPLAERAAELGIRLTRTYGSSETSGGCVYDGVPIGNTRVRVVEGEVQLAGSVLADGYVDDVARTEANFPREGAERWYLTGDTGLVTDGRLVVTGRLDDVIISGGLKVSLADVEREVRSILDQSDAVVVRAPSARWGEVPVVVTTRPIDLEILRSTVGEHLGPAAAPDRVIVLDALPLLASGKPDRQRLRSLAQ